MCSDWQKHGEPGAKYSSLVTALGEAIQVEARVLRVRQQRRRHLASREGESDELANEEAKEALKAKLGEAFLDESWLDAAASRPRGQESPRGGRCGRRGLADDDAGEAGRRLSYEVQMLLGTTKEWLFEHVW